MKTFDFILCCESHGTDCYQTDVYSPAKPGRLMRVLGVMRIPQLNLIDSHEHLAFSYLEWCAFNIALLKSLFCHFPSPESLVKKYCTGSGQRISTHKLNRYRITRISRASLLSGYSATLASSKESRSQASLSVDATQLSK